MRVHVVDLVLEPIHLTIGDAQGRVGKWLAGRDRRQVGAEIEQVVLDTAQNGIERVARRVQANEAEACIGFVDRAVSLDAKVIFRPTPSRCESRRPVSPVRV